MHTIYKVNVVVVVVRILYVDVDYNILAECYDDVETATS